MVVRATISSCTNRVTNQTSASGSGGGPTIPENAVVDRDGAYILDRDGAYIIADPTPRTS